MDGTVTNLLQFPANNITIIGDTDVSRKDWTDGAEPVIVNANGKGRLFSCQKSGCSIRNIAVAGCVGTGSGYAALLAIGSSSVGISNCVVRGSAKGLWSCAIWSDAVMHDSTWTNNAAGFRGTAYRCDFLNNAKATEYLSAYDCRFKGNSGDMGSNINILSNCVFEANTGYMRCKTTATVIDCVFTNNNITSGSILSNARLVKRCEFVDNTISKSCLFYKDAAVDANIEKCTFLRNTCNPGWYGTGGPIYMERTEAQPYTMIVTNCTFEGNSCPGNTYLYPSAGAIYASTNGLAAGETGWDYCTVVDCNFITNSAGGRAGVSGVHAIRCKFDRNRRTSVVDYHSGGDASESFLEDCDITGGELVDSVISRCTVHDVSNGGYASVFREYTRATNCLVVGCSPGSDGNQMLYYARARLDAEFVNCTFVSNKVDTFVAGGSNVNLTNAFRVVNCVFNGNVGTQGSESDLLLNRNNADDKWFWSNCVSFESSYYGKFVPNSNRLSAEMFAAVTNAPNSLMQCENPMFVKDKHPDEPYWSLSLKSPLLGKGDPLDFTDADLDLAGRPRLKDGEIDVGCYQCWLKQLGLLMIVR